MNKSILKQAFLLLLLARVFSSCVTMDTFIPEEKFSPEVTDAQLWFDKQEIKAEGVRIVLPDGQIGFPLWPDWKMTFSEEDSLYRYLGVHLKPSRKIHSVTKNEDGTDNVLSYEQQHLLTTPECMAKFQETNDSRYLATITRLIIRTEKGTNEKFGFIMLAYPELSYLEENIDNPFNNFTYLKHGDGVFNGITEYYHIDGSFSNAWRFLDGKYCELLRSEEKND